MKLTQQQIEYIRTFIKQRGFTAMDLQLEIIDHVACRIEEKMGKNPALSFEAALQQTHAEFGVLGFGQLEAAMVSSLRKKYFRQIQLELKRWLSFPGVLLVGSFAWIVYQLFFRITTPWLLAIAGSIYFAVSLGAFLYLWWLERRYRKLMVMQFAAQFVLLPTFLFQVGFLFSELSDQMEQYPEYTLIYACLFVGFTLLFTFLFSAFFRIISYAIQRCREFEQLKT